MISWTRVSQLKDEMGSDGFDELVVLFLEEADEVALQLQREGDSPTLMDDLHFLKGCAANIGFERVEELCTRAEYAARDGNFAAIDLAGILTSYSASRQIFLAGVVKVPS